MVTRCLSFGGRPVKVINMLLSFILQRCDRCGQSGATVGCCLATCQSNFHFMCARAQSCVFQQDRKVYCYKHRDLVSTKVWTLTFLFLLIVVFFNIAILLIYQLSVCVFVIGENITLSVCPHILTPDHYIYILLIYLYPSR